MTYSPFDKLKANGKEPMAYFFSVHGEPFDLSVHPEPVEGERTGSGQARRTMQNIFSATRQNVMTCLR